MKDIERMVVSAHVDGEVESPWKEKVEQRLATDSDWASEANLHRGVKEALASARNPTGRPLRIGSRPGFSRAQPRRQLPVGWVSLGCGGRAGFGHRRRILGRSPECPGHSGL